MDMLLVFGIVAPIWMLFGVAWVASKYPGYSHKAQVMSELGARSRRTEKIQPLVNNYPIGTLFSIFGIGLLLNFPDHIYTAASAVLIFIHGASHIVAGIFPCDADLGLEKPSPAQKVHNAAGVVMYFSLLAACFLWAVPSASDSVWFKWYSLTSAVVSAVFLVFMLREMNSGEVGLYQRLSYGILVAWSATLSAVVVWA